MRDIKSFLLAGRANFTLVSTKLDKRYTYLITKDKKRDDRYFAKVLFGPDNEHDYRYIGLFYTNYRDTIGTLKTSTAAHLPHTTPQFVMLQYFLRIISNDMLWPPTCQFYPSGKCAVCGRKLTTPESIELGIGPECYKRKRR